MGRSTSKILLYACATGAQQQQLIQQLDRLGYSAVEKISTATQLDGVATECSCLLLFLADTAPAQNDILAILHHARNLPIIGLFSPDSPLYLQPVIDACVEVEHFPCANQILDFQLGRLFACGDENMESDDSLLLKTSMVGNSPEFRQVVDKLRKIAQCDAPVYIDGETGTGKELAARAIHYLGARRDKPFIAANCGAFPDQLVENELFGHEKGAYTDACESSDGLISQAQGGTLFLDEIETLSQKGQVVLLRFLENMKYRPLGGKAERTADLRVIAATNESISQRVENGSFRKDLYYRINIMNLELPPLRERRDDITLLAEHFIRRFQVDYRQPDRQLHPDSFAALKFHDWPGNVRELENLLHREFLFAEGRYVVLTDIEAMRRERRADSGDRRLRQLLDNSMTVAKHNLISNFERRYLASALNRAGGNISEAARLAGKERKSFTRLLDKHGIDRNHYKLC